MEEAFLHFVWQFQKFTTPALTTVEGQPLHIYTIGQHNTDEGPDFLNARLCMDGVTWCGHVEIHVKSSDWLKHGHQKNAGYNNVVLHVVWEYDGEAVGEDGHAAPVVELRDYVQPELMARYQTLMDAPTTIACEGQIHRVREIDQWAMLHHAGVHRLECKSSKIIDRLNKNRGDWEETVYQLLAENFGFKANGEALLQLSERLPHKILVKHRQNRRQLEALMFGLSGLLASEGSDDYVQGLKREFDFLAKKYGLQDATMSPVEWKFLRMYPANFPSVRLAQLAAFIAENPACFQTLIGISDVKQLHQRFEIKVSAYWQTHYRLGKKSSTRRGALGKGSIDLLLINTVAPLLAAYARHTDDETYMERAVALLQSVAAENNRIIRQWKKWSVSPKDAFDSQSVISLYQTFCLKKKCLSCKIGTALINH